MVYPMITECQQDTDIEDRTKTQRNAEGRFLIEKLDSKLQGLREEMREIKVHLNYTVIKRCVAGREPFE